MKSLKRFMSFVSPYKKDIFSAIIFGLLKFSFPLITPILLKYIIDNLLFNEGLTKNEKNSQLFLILLIMLFLFIIVRPIVEYFRQFFAHNASNKILKDVREQLFSHLQKLSLRFYSNTKSGEIISRTIFDVEQTKIFVQTGLINMWLDAFTITIVLIIMFNLNVTLSLFSLIAFPLYIFSVKYFYKKLKISTKERSQALANVQSHLYEKIQGIAAILSFTREKEEMKKFNETNKELFDKSTIHNKRNATTFAIVNTVAEISPILVIFTASLLVVNHNLTLGTMVAFIGLLSHLYNPLKRLTESTNGLTQSIASIERIYELIDEEYDIKDYENAKAIEIEKGNLKFENVCFSYNENYPILKNISLDIKNGETVAFVGESGGGKSSLINLLPRFYNTTKGDIFIDEKNIKKYSLNSLRKQIGFISQENILFNESVLENIKIGNSKATEEEVIMAAKKANAHDFIINLEKGYDTEIGERGVKLSGGQKQRITLARLFLKQPKILILDEATSALDLESEHYIQETLHLLSENRTTIIVAHRLSTITNADKIVYIEKGEIKEVGNHKELMKKKSYYYRLYQYQFEEKKRITN